MLLLLLLWRRRVETKVDRSVRPTDYRAHLPLHPLVGFLPSKTPPTKGEADCERRDNHYAEDGPGDGANVQEGKGAGWRWRLLAADEKATHLQIERID